MRFKQKTGVLIICLLFVSILSVSLISASWIDDFFGKITGNVISGCVDDDNTVPGLINGPSRLSQGNTSGVWPTSGEQINVTDYCFQDGRLVEYICREDGYVSAAANNCPTGESCSGGKCISGSCTPSCAGKTCGDDGCGGSCGTCSSVEVCQSGSCICPSPYHVQSGANCVWSCGAGTTPDSITNECICKEGYVETGQDQFGRRVCEETTSTCTPNCIGKQCGNDGCGGSCGTCNPDEICQSGSCAKSIPDFSQSCKDSDVNISFPGGINYYEKGTLEIGEVSASDSCKNGVTLTEWYCEGGLSTKLEYECPGGCESGRCLSEEYYGCYRTDDGDIYRKGKLCIFRTKDNAEICTFEDFCGTGAGSLSQTECTSDSEYQQKWKGCLLGCKSGVCVCEEGDCAEGYSCVDGSCVLADSGCAGCLLKDVCYGEGTRKDDKYCSLIEAWHEQKPAGDTCTEDFECHSNFCEQGECLERSFLRYLLNLFKKLLGK